MSSKSSGRSRCRKKCSLPPTASSPSTAIVRGCYSPDVPDLGYWLVFLLAGAGAFVAAHFLDEREQRAAVPPSAPSAPSSSPSAPSSPAAPSAPSA